MADVPNFGVPVIGGAGRSWTHVAFEDCGYRLKFPVSVMGSCSSIQRPA